VAAPGGIVVWNSRLSGTDELPLKNVTIGYGHELARGRAEPTRRRLPGEIRVGMAPRAELSCEEPSAFFARHPESVGRSRTPRTPGRLAWSVGPLFYAQSGTSGGN
jgi:hypothetical protein